MGVGSALDEKYLIIFEGDTAAAEDDLVVEAKQIRDLAGNPCVRTDVGASRVLDGQRLIAYEPFAYAAVVPHGDKFFWVHDWTDDYQEASIASAILSPRDLREVAYDAGVQMGRAHPKRPDGAPDKDRRQAVARVAGRDRGPGARRDSRDGGEDRGGLARRSGRERRPRSAAARYGVPGRSGLREAGSSERGSSGSGSSGRTAEDDETATGQIRGVLRASPRGVYHT